MSHAIALKRRPSGYSQLSYLIGGRTVLVSKYYVKDSDAKQDIDTIRRKATDQRFYNRIYMGNGKCKFVLVSSDRTVLATSPVYWGVGAMESDIQAILKSADTATVTD